MTISNGYATLDSLKAVLSIPLTDTVDDVALETSIEAASRQIEAHCGRGRKFWVDPVAVARKYFPGSPNEVEVHDISSVTGLIVKIDTGDDGSFASTLTYGTDFEVHPINAAADSPARPFTKIRILAGSSAIISRVASGRPQVEVTAKYGWPAIPTAVERACIFQAKNIFKAPDLFYGSFQLADEGSALRVPSMDPLSRALLEEFVRQSGVDDV